MSILVYINRKASNLRSWFKLREKEAKVAKHPVRMKIYGFVQRTIKRIANWLASHASEETKAQLRNDPFRVEHEQKALARFQNNAVLRWIKTPEWVANLHQLKTGTQTTIGDIHGN